ncbi:MAG: DUF2061 domain-containing protein [bacterium]|nr:DUF2061 domain-containing protein [bacterium]
MIEKRRRSIVKALSWRITATVATVMISYVITGQVETAIKIGFVELFAKMALYYGHERFWSNVKFGLAKPVDYQI